MPGRVEFYTLPGDEARVRELVSRDRGLGLWEYLERVRPVVEDIRRRGYQAVREYSVRFDGYDPVDPVLDRNAMREAFDSIGERERWALETVARAVRRFHDSVRPPETWVPGARLVWSPVRRVGVYAPGGMHPYPSTVIHTVAPARAARVPWVAVATPPCRGGSGGCGGFPVNPVTLAAAYAAGADVVYSIGGAQAVAAMAFGAGPVEPVDKIVGPGNPYVQAAKLLVSSVVGIDMVAGPTELAVVADSSADPEEVALDMAAEAEHGPLSIAVLFTDSGKVGEAVAERLEQLASNDMGRLAVVVARGFEEALRYADMFAAEHLVAYVSESNRSRMLENPPRAGIVSLGVPPALLDYGFGPSHVLPTGGAARWRGGLGFPDYSRLVAVVEGEPPLDGEAWEASVLLARLEGFRFHAESLRARLESRSGGGP